MGSNITLTINFLIMEGGGREYRQTQKKKIIETFSFSIYSDRANYTV